MSPSVRPSVTARRDAILCAIRDGALVTTGEVCKAICAACATGHVYHHYSQVYADLRALDRIGMIHWQPSNGVSGATWMLSTKAREAFVTEDLESIWVRT